MIKIHEDMTYGEFKKIIEGNQCKLMFKDNYTYMYVEPGQEVTHDDFIIVDKVEILDQKRTNIADKAKEIIYGDREKTYGEPEKNIKTIAKFWSTFLDQEITPEDVCDMMCLLKIARLRSNPVHEDSMIDLVGYTLLKEIIINKC